MSFANRHSKGSRFTWKVPDEKANDKANFHKLKDYPEGTEIRIMSMYINSKGKYQPHPVFISSDNEFIDIPSGNTDEVKQIMENDEDVADINAGKVGIKIESYTSKQYGDQVGFKWVDLDPIK